MGLYEFFSRMFRVRKKEVKVLVVGLDNSGKTTILNMLKPKECQNTNIVPTVGFSVEKIIAKPLEFTCFDMSGHNRYRSLWEHYYQDCDAIIFVVDSSDHLRLVVAQDEFEQLIENPAIKKRWVPLLIYANKMDIPGSLLASDVAQSLDLEKIRDKPWNIVATNGLTGEGVREGVTWLCEKLVR
ncbi:unnamed protein product [Calicophoron daubneyi]|uniref:ADP-ribosylation factor-like protein 6 n=1 Tax=Calicophoron daubneyi TaxID=300641 RepID=A0AAV2T280_CALDB